MICRLSVQIAEAEEHRPRVDDIPPLATRLVKFKVITIPRKGCVSSLHSQPEGLEEPDTNTCNGGAVHAHALPVSVVHHLDWTGAGIRADTALTKHPETDTHVDIEVESELTDEVQLTVKGLKDDLRPDKPTDGRCVRQAALQIVWTFRSLTGVRLPTFLFSGSVKIALNHEVTSGQTSDDQLIDMIAQVQPTTQVLDVFVDNTHLETELKL